MEPKVAVPAPELPRRSDWRILCAILLMALALRGVILFTGQRYLRSDEAAVGLMAKHIITRGETPVFLYGQTYGGGHAIVAYIAAPLFAVFGRSAELLTGISAAVSLLNIWLLWIILRRRFGRDIAAAAATLYAVSPPVVYQAFLINGGTETFCLALLALLFFLRDYLDGAPGRANVFLAGLFGGLAYWGMDYALLYPVVFAVLWAAAGGHGVWRKLFRFALGFVVGCLPLLLYDFTHDFTHVRQMLSAPPGLSVGLVPHVFGALRGLVTGDLAAFFGGDIDDFNPAGIGAWLHATAATLAIAAVIWHRRHEVADRLRTRPFRMKEPAPLSADLLPGIFVLAYLAMYSVAKFSLPQFRTPRYFLPLCPFVSIAIAWVALRWRVRAVRTVGWAIIALLVAHGAMLSLEIGMRPWHREWGIRTSGREIAALADFARERNIRTAFAPYEIQWRLMFETDEAVTVTSEGISRLPRYRRYGDDVADRVWNKRESFAFFFRNDFAFAELGPVTRAAWEGALTDAGLSTTPAVTGDEFRAYYPLKSTFLHRLAQRLSDEKQRGAEVSLPHP